MKPVFPEPAPSVFDVPVPLTKPRILVADDHELFRRGIIALLDSTDEFNVVAEATTPQETLSKLRECPVDMAILDLSFEGTNGLELTKQIRAEHPELRIILVSMHDEQVYAVRALKSGAQGYVMKREDPSVLLAALRKVAAGSTYLSSRITQSLVYRSAQGYGGASSPIDALSDRELEVLQLFGEGFRTKEIATRLHLSAKTIETHRLHIKDKLQLKSAPDLVRFAISWLRVQTDGLREPASSRAAGSAPPLSD
jgi:DNA-binding NarL/FixJ family response regulator